MNPTIYITEADLLDIAAATTFVELCQIAKRILERMPDPVIGIADVFSDTLTTASLDVFNHTTNVLIEAGYSVFNEQPFQDKLEELKAKWFQKNHENHCIPLAQEFFLPLLQTGKIKVLLLLPNWQDNYLSYLEDDVATKKGIKIIQLQSDWGTKTDKEKIMYDTTKIIGLVKPKKTETPSEDVGSQDVAESHG
jgi:hypothetical protein